MRYAIIENGLVVNIAVSDLAIDENWIVIPEGLMVDIGWTYVDGFAEPENG